MSPVSLFPFFLQFAVFLRISTHQWPANRIRSNSNNRNAKPSTILETQNPACQAPFYRSPAIRLLSLSLSLALSPFFFVSRFISRRLSNELWARDCWWKHRRRLAIYAIFVYRCSFSHLAPRATRFVARKLSFTWIMPTIYEWLYRKIPTIFLAEFSSPFENRRDRSKGIRCVTDSCPQLIPTIHQFSLFSNLPWW